MSKRIARLATVCLALFAIVVGTAVLMSPKVSAVECDAGGGEPSCPACTTEDLGPCVQNGHAGRLHKTTCWTCQLGVCVPHTTYSCD